MSQDKVNYPVSTAAVHWIDSAGGLHVRVYTCDGYMVQERSTESGQWTNGTLHVAASHVSAIAWADSAGAHVRVYCTSKNVTTEWCQDPGTTWVAGQYTTV